MLVVEEEKCDNYDSFLEDKDHHKRLPIFLGEPYHTTNLVLTTDDIKNLDPKNSDTNKWLSTKLIDFLIKYGTPLFKPEDYLVPTSNIEPLLDIYIEKAQSDKLHDILFVEKARNKYQGFKTKNFRINSISCQNGHFFVIFMIFNPHKTI